MTRFIALLTLVAFIGVASMAYAAASGADIQVYDINSPTQAGISGITVQLVGIGGTHALVTDANGWTHFNVPAGDYDVYVNGDLKDHIVIKPNARLSNRIGTAYS